MRDGFYSGAIRSPVRRYAMSDADRIHKHGPLIPMEAPRKSLFKALRDAWRGW